MRNLGIAFCMALICMSCDDNRVYDAYETVGIGWSIDEPVQFELGEMDSLQVYNMFLTLRNNHLYPYSNLYLITTMDYPNGKRETDTLEYAMAKPDGEWLGQGFGDIKENKLWFKEGVRFRESGNYLISIRHAMRKNGNINGDATLEGITEVGLRIERPE